MKHLFGTDGIRGVAGSPPLDPATVYAVGLALGDDLGSRSGGATPAVLLGQDTRASGRWIAETLAGGLMARNLAVRYAGVLPTPGVAYLTRALGMSAGVMISASHNPYQDNGIKIFGPGGYKLPDAEEADLEAGIAGYRRARVEPRRAPLLESAALCAAYVDFLAAHAAADLGGLAVVADCAHGAAAGIAAGLFQRLGVRTTLLGDRPDGRNINAGCGALHPEALAAHVPAAGAAAGVAFDGDADRAIFVDGAGAVVNGDAVLFMAARDLKRRGILDPPLVVGTVMTNLGLEQALAREGIRLERTPVGDKYVLEAMLAAKARLGGEPSGHVIFGAEATTGDGLLTALHVFGLMARERRPLAELRAGWSQLPQRIVNVRVRTKPPLERLAPVQRAIAAAQSHFGSGGRILVRYSGTEPLARVMVEAESAAEVERHANAIAAALHDEVGVPG